MTDSFKLVEMQRTSIEFERQRHLTNWLISSGPHMATPPPPTLPTTTTTTTSNLTTPTTATQPATFNGNSSTTANSAPQPVNDTSASSSLPVAAQQPPQGISKAHNGSSGAANNGINNSNGNPVLFLMSSNGNTGAIGHAHSGRQNSSSAGHFALSKTVNATGSGAPIGLSYVEVRKPKLRRYNSHDTSSNMFSVADFENARLARRNEIELQQRLQRRARAADKYGDCALGDSKSSKYGNVNEPLPADIFLERFSLPRVAILTYKTKFSDETLQSSSSNGSSTVTSSSSAGGNVGKNSGTTGTSSSNNTTGSSGSAKRGKAALKQCSSEQENEELFVLYRLVRDRQIFHGHNSKTSAANLKKGVLIPQEFPGYFSFINEKGLPTATLYTSLVQLVRERVYKFISVDNMTSFTESQPNANSSPTEGCLPLYSPQSNNRPQYVRSTARGGQVFRLLAVFEDGKQDHNAFTNNNNLKLNTSHGREKEKGRYAQLLNENRQILYVSLSTKGKFYEIEPGIPQILQKLSGVNNNDPNKKINPDCVHKITTLITPTKELPITLRYIAGPQCGHITIPDTICITKITTENVVIVCPIDDVEVQSPLHLRKLHLTKEMYLLKDTLGFENEKRMLANTNVQNILKYCQFNCDQFLKIVEIEILNRSERSGSKSRVEGLKILKPLHLPKLLRREKTTILAHEKEDSIIFLSKNDLANMEAKDTVTNTKTQRITTVEGASSSNRISEKMKVFQSTKKKWFRKQDKHTSTNNFNDSTAQTKSLSMERYSDMSKLLQERFSDKTNTIDHDNMSEHSCNSEPGGSDTETTTLATIEEKLKKFGDISLKSTVEVSTLQKSMSLQDIELISGVGGTRKPDLLSTLVTTDTISEAGTDLEDLENAKDTTHQTSFITEKLYNEFHVKTRQYSKSSSSLHQLLNFSLPQKMQMNDKDKRASKMTTGNNAPGNSAAIGKLDKRFDFNVGEPVTGRRAAGGLTLLTVGNNGSAYNSQNTSLISPLTPMSMLEDELPYSNVRDSLVLSSDESPLHHQRVNICRDLNLVDYTKENIYAEICHDLNTMSNTRPSHVRENYSAGTHSTRISDDYGDYASLSYPTPRPKQRTSDSGKSIIGNAISRVHVNCSASPVSYHTVYFGDEPLGENYTHDRNTRATGRTRESRHSRNSRDSQPPSRDRTHITTVELEGATQSASSDIEGFDNIYNTLK
ncbi:uncharacterized protein LOC119662503 isoform X2 [Teleopsis dalmanni]|uniref:uncharacterized protein LOC119662503 isoform X2 n=1 Tax=Teleopsis dalmanni TaxID=139649 RepID=UPI0018CE8256|nr:uncharacterized protein LOC119662503 isoform X2 [Teleopsis dalmanni]